MNDNKHLYIDFDQYIKQAEPSAQQSAYEWSTAIGLQAVDGLKPSDYLLQTAKRNIEGEITIDEVQELLRSYYNAADARSQKDEQYEEADKVSANIKKILSTRTLAFNTNGYISIHRRIFDGVFKHAGKIRQFDISKKEWVLRGDTVNYLNWEDLRRALDWDIQQEHDFSYKGLSADEKIKHICRFASGLWQIHAFCEGNTRTTAVFLIQYLRSIGYDVNNDLFAKHSWYFRNALVRANYKNNKFDIDFDYSYLELFFRNLLLGECHELKNRFLLINSPEGFDATQQANCGIDCGIQLSERQQNILSELRIDGTNTAKRLAGVIGYSQRTIETELSFLRKNGFIQKATKDNRSSWIVIGK